MSIDTAVSRLAESRFASDEILDRVAKAPRSRCCNAPIQGVAMKWCGNCGGSIAAADIDHETHAPLVKPGGAR